MAGSRGSHLRHGVWKAGQCEQSGLSAFQADPEASWLAQYQTLRSAAHSSDTGINSGRLAESRVGAAWAFERSMHIGCLFPCTPTHARRCRGKSGSGAVWTTPGKRIGYLSPQSLTRFTQARWWLRLDSVFW